MIAAAMQSELNARLAYFDLEWVWSARGWSPWCHGVCSMLPWLVIPDPAALHTAWMPQPCRWDCMAAASMQYGPVLERRA
jgi:hypothetical protein